MRSCALLELNLLFKVVGAEVCELAVYVFEYVKCLINAVNRRLELLLNRPARVGSSLGRPGFPKWSI